MSLLLALTSGGGVTIDAIPGEYSWAGNSFELLELPTKGGIVDYDYSRDFALLQHQLSDRYRQDDEAILAIIASFIKEIV